MIGLHAYVPMSGTATSPSQCMCSCTESEQKWSPPLFFVAVNESYLAKLKDVCNTTPDGCSKNMVACQVLQMCLQVFRHILGSKGPVMAAHVAESCPPKGISQSLSANSKASVTACASNSLSLKLHAHVECIYSILKGTFPRSGGTCAWHQAQLSMMQPEKHQAKSP